MLTNLTNQTRPATLTLSTLGTRSLALVVDGNVTQVRAQRDRHVPHLPVGMYSPVGMITRPIVPEAIRGDRHAVIPGSPRDAGWVGSAPWSSPSSTSFSGAACFDPRHRSIDEVARRHVVPVGVGAVVWNTATAPAATRKAHALHDAPAAARIKRPAVLGG